MGTQKKAGKIKQENYSDCVVNLMSANSCVLLVLSVHINFYCKESFEDFSLEIAASLGDILFNW